jgi:hypothetical protein
MHLLQQDGAFRLWYVASGLALLLVPMLALAVWVSPNHQPHTGCAC